MNIMNNCDSGDTVLTVLAFSCFALAEYLLSVLKKSDKAAAVCSCVSAFIAFLIYSDNLIFVLCFAVIYAVDKFGAGKYFRHIGAVSVLLVLFIVKPPFIDVLILIIMLVAFTVAHITAGQLIKCREQLAESREKTVRLNRRIASLEEYAKTAKKSAAVEERRRFSARIHDKLGHSISGSIILLEAAKLNVRTNPDSAEQCITTVTDNLRSGVDDIRQALREERPDSKTIGISELKEILGEYKAKYNIRTTLEIKGDADRITFRIWNCIKENLVETLTNTLKHSGADEFSLKISVMNKVIRAEFKDNGKGSDSFRKGTGLTAIEERTVLTDGKCIFPFGSKHIQSERGERMKIIIADDDSIIREGLKMIISSQPDFEVTGVACNGAEAVELCRKYKTDIALLDIRMPVMDGIEAAKIMLEENLCKPLLLTTFDEQELIHRALKVGVSGYILKNTQTDGIFSALRTVYNGGTVFQQDILSYIRDAAVKCYGKSAVFGLLTERELDIVKLIADGCSNAEIAEKLFLSNGTVRNYISVILEKTGLEHRTQIAVRYLKGDE